MNYYLLYCSGIEKYIKLYYYQFYLLIPNILIYILNIFYDNIHHMYDDIYDHN
jgi:hypothetical protein